MVGLYDFVIIGRSIETFYMTGNLKKGFLRDILRIFFIPGHAIG